MKLKFFFLVTVLFLGIAPILFAQKITIQGKVTDAENGEPVPFANVFFPGTQVGTTTDFEGNYLLKCTPPGDSLAASYVGYAQRLKAIDPVKSTQQVNFQLLPEAKTLEAVEIIAGEWENPAWEILRLVNDRKKYNNPDKLSAFEYESYTKTELDVDNISEKFKKKKIMQKITAVTDAIEKMAGDDGKPILPVFISEALSHYYFRRNPERSHEQIHKTKVMGIALDDGSFVSQIIGSSFQQYNFYHNWLTVSEKDFVSPIAESWRFFYDYELQDEFALVENDTCFKIAFQPKRPQDLAFTGTMWIHKNSYALRRLDAQIGKEANLNFIEKIKIQQEAVPVVAEQDTAWLVSKSRILLDIGEVRDDWAGMLAKFYVSNKNFKVNAPHELKFYEEEISLDEEVTENDPAFWQANRHDSLTATEQNVYLMIDTIRNLPTIKTYVEIADLFINGYKDFGPVGIGTYSYLFAVNNIEGPRVRLGFRTNDEFHKRLVLHGRAAYGFKDKEIKYNGGLSYQFSKKPWFIGRIRAFRDLSQVAIFNEDLLNSNNHLFLASTYWGDLTDNRPFYHKGTELQLQGDMWRGGQLQLTTRYFELDPLFRFAYYSPLDGETVKTQIHAHENIAEVRFSFKEKFLYNGNERYSLGTGGRPIFRFRYTLGNLLMGEAGNFTYHRYFGEMQQRFRLGLLGSTEYVLRGGWIPQNLPYPLLEAHLGNEGPFYNELSFNLMNFFEFVSDTHASLRVTHRFEGLILNRIPLMRRLKWRTFVEGAFLWGSLRDGNLNIIPEENEFGEAIPRFQSLNPNEPYIELAYGIENIFRFLRVQGIHRVSYLDSPNASRFGVKVSAQFRF